jgi:hypothetical protein
VTQKLGYWVINAMARMYYDVIAQYQDDIEVTVLAYGEGVK